MIVANPVTTVLRELGLAGTRSNTKFVPDSYRYNSAEVRHAVLQGLLDTDGGPVTQARRSCRIQYTTTSPQLHDDVVFLVRSLGGIAYSPERARPRVDRPDGRRDARCVSLTTPSCSTSVSPPTSAPFRLTRKAGTYRAFGGGGRPMRFIDSIEPAGMAETVCIQVARRIRCTSPTTSS